MITDENKEIRFVTNKEELDRMCPHLNHGLICVSQYTQRCMKQEEQDQFHRLYSGTRKVIEDVCEEGQYQQEYLRHAPCVQKVRSDDENCAAKYQRELLDINQETPSNVSSQSESNKNVQKVCCSLQTYLECSERAVLTMCGPETAAFTKGLLDTMASSLIQTHCEKYPAGSEECSSSGSLRHGIGTMQLSLGLAAVIILLVLQQIRT
ncbi:uncharacterized protein [Anabrus simplex]|uniref:uncharacterized protein n=1 Tax=Anabrus simplex TaxID=316456 RepID=UPI0035A2DB1B